MIILDYSRFGTGAGENQEYSRIVQSFGAKKAPHKALLGVAGLARDRAKWAERFLAASRTANAAARNNEDLGSAGAVGAGPARS